MKTHYTGLFGAVWLASCASTPPPSLPDNAVPAHFDQVIDSTAPLWPSATWWQGFDDPQLNELISRAQTENWDLFQASARVRQADARARQAGAAFLPTVDLNANATSFYGRSHEISIQETDYGASLGVSYDLDFWGKHRDAAQSADAARRATVADRATVALTITASVATTYFQLLSVQEHIESARANIKASEATLDVVQRRVDAGYAAAADLTQQRATLAAQRAELPALEQQALELHGALALLVGVAPEQLTLRPARLADVRAPAVRPGLPSELLTRRPDLVSAENALVAAHADLALARKAYLPDISLTANGGVAYPALAAAVKTLPGFGLAANVGGTLTQTIFDGGRTHYKIEESSAREQELLGAYRAAVLAALSDVENALGSIVHQSEQESALQTQVEASQRVLRSAQLRYSAGSADFLVITDAQRTLYTGQDQLADIRRAHLASIVTLYKALGGGWEAPPGSEAASEARPAPPTLP
jgi:NodT family efflux transporter outer membrane factor (OMF) lipoprotein